MYFEGCVQTLCLLCCIYVKCCAPQSATPLAASKRTTLDAKNVCRPRDASLLFEYLPESLLRELAVSRPPKLAVTDPEGGVVLVTLSEWLWRGSNSQRMARQALRSGFIQGIKSGLLDPRDFGGYTVQDAVFCYHVTQYFKMALAKSVGDPTLATILQAQIQTYEKYTRKLFEQWRITDPSGISMGKAADWYTNFEREIAEEMRPVYLLIAMLPCEELWSWLAYKIQSGISETNVYSFWIEDIPRGRSILATFIDDNFEKYGVHPETAKYVYEKAMYGEIGFFDSATRGED